MSALAKTYKKSLVLLKWERTSYACFIKYVSPYEAGFLCHFYGEEFIVDNHPLKGSLNQLLKLFVSDLVAVN